MRGYGYCYCRTLTQYIIQQKIIMCRSTLSSPLQWNFWHHCLSTAVSKDNLVSCREQIVFNDVPAVRPWSVEKRSRSPRSLPSCALVVVVWLLVYTSEMSFLHAMATLALSSSLWTSIADAHRLAVSERPKGYRFASDSCTSYPIFASPLKCRFGMSWPFRVSRLYHESQYQSIY